MGLMNEVFNGIERDIKKNPNNSNLWANRGVLLDNMGRYEEAIESFDKAIKINPDFSFAWTSRGITLEKLGRYEEAIESYDKSLKIDPKNWVTQIGQKNRERIKRKVTITIEGKEEKREDEREWIEDTDDHVFIEVETAGCPGCFKPDHQWKKTDDQQGKNGPVQFFICEKCENKGILFSYRPENDEIKKWTNYAYFQKKNQ